MKHEELKEVLRLHKLWLDDEAGGVCANLSGADLCGVDLCGADLSNAELKDRTMSDVECRTKLALQWALEKTQFKLPEPVSDAGSWEWDDEDLSFVTDNDESSFAFHVEVNIGATKRRIAVLTWSDSDGQAIWEGYVPESVWQGGSK